MPHEAIAKLFFDRLTLEFQPGEAWEYSNSGYLLLGNIIERVTGKTYWQSLSERIFTPLGMNASGSSEPSAIIANRATGYEWRNGRFESRPALHENAYAAGAIA
ncbi:MAG TPA: serine hydrolase domain-containing protein [Thermoanaerobaculia bacterium]|nr:serine hydrolase domain-containing protein [Thermoanaerobaculia bacterium]